MSKSWSTKTRKSNKINSDGVFADHEGPHHCSSTNRCGGSQTVVSGCQRSAVPWRLKTVFNHRTGSRIDRKRIRISNSSQGGVIFSRFPASEIKGDTVSGGPGRIIFVCGVNRPFPRP